MKKLYQVKPKTVVQVPGGNSPFFFDHPDGMYSVCYDVNKNLYHIAITAEVEEVTDVTLLDKFKGFL